MVSKINFLFYSNLKLVWEEWKKLFHKIITYRPKGVEEEVRLYRSVEQLPGRGPSSQSNELTRGPPDS